MSNVFPRKAIGPSSMDSLSRVNRANSLPVRTSQTRGKWPAANKNRPSGLNAAPPPIVEQQTLTTVPPVLAFMTSMAPPPVIVRTLPVKPNRTVP